MFVCLFFLDFWLWSHSVCLPIDFKTSASKQLFKISKTNASFILQNTFLSLWSEGWLHDLSEVSVEQAFENRNKNIFLLIYILLFKVALRNVSIKVSFLLFCMAQSTWVGLLHAIVFT